jgi:valyl-tRNA synthetase
MSIFDKSYNAKDHEERIYKLWEESGFFNPDNLPEQAGLPTKSKKTYCITVPPPNVTGSLHMGHALNATIQDILIRKKRMEGYKTLWLPGTDHAGIATQNAVEKQLKKEGTSRHDLGREKFLEKVWEWKEKYGDIILEQFKTLGCSMDWSRTRFTMDEDYQDAVKEAFLHYHKKGWIYQGKRVVSWCTRCQTSLSDLELEYNEEQGKLWFIKYPLAAPSDNITHILVATTRPETMLGDTAVAVNPKDERYKDLVGKEILLPIQNRKIPVVSDRRVEMDFGTGAVKVTPAHDMLDEQIGLDNKLPFIQIINEFGKMTDAAGEKFAGMKVKEARETVVKELEEKDLIEKIEDYTHNIGVCYRCGTTIEPTHSDQWFLKMDELAKHAIKSVESGKVKFHPDRWNKLYLDWLENVRDWTISRQIWWGHKIPIDGVDDVLDTWFSSALWPFATLGWPEKTKDLKDFYPTQVLSTARDIINLWVARMIFSGMEFMKNEPFADVIIHATILTKDGKRMSKSLGTGIDPINLIEKYGADATRFGLIWQAMGTQDIHWSEEHLIAGKKFANKIWNTARFVTIQTTELQISKKTPSAKTEADKIILQKFEEVQKESNVQTKTYAFGQALHLLYDFWWHDFCDIYLEESKKQTGDAKTKKNTEDILSYVLIQSLKLLHPFMPFVTETIWQELKVSNKPLIIEDWPV